MVPSTSSSSPESVHKTELVHTLRGLLREVLRLRREGVAYQKLAAAQGYADGFMRALIDGGISSRGELLGIVAEVRRGVDGPAVTSLKVDSDETASVAA